MARIHITGAAGTGTSTLARALAAKLRIPHFDSDFYYWVPTLPPYKIKREPAVRDGRLREDLATFDDWIWSGSAVKWGHEADRRITLCVFLTLASDVRLPRLRAREEAEHAALPFTTEAEAEQEIRLFLEWAARYDEGDVDVRSRKLHEEWLTTLQCPILRLEGDLPTNDQVTRVLDAMG
ncbi:MAG: P-loop NTPase family protein [Planctomycetota bacterium]|jgi:adenylate kinase family enzyme